MRMRTVMSLASAMILVSALAVGARAEARISSLAVSPDGKTFAAGYEKGGLALYDFATQKKIRDFKGHTKDVRGIAFSPDGRTLASGGDNVRLWNAETGEQLAALEGHREGFGVWGWLRAVTFSPDGKTLASAGADGTVKLWDVSAKKELRTLLEPSDHPVLTVAFSPDGRLLATGHNDATAKVWNVATGKLLRELKDGDDGTAAPYALAFTPDGKTLVSGNRNSKVILWDTAAWKPLREIRTGSMDSMALSADGKLLAFADNDVKIWDVGSGVVVQKLYEVGRFVAFGRDGKQLLGGTWDTGLKLEAVNPD